ncbi:kelch repeat protein [Ostertagia ostertagi]
MQYDPRRNQWTSVASMGKNDICILSLCSTVVYMPLELKNTTPLPTSGPAVADMNEKRLGVALAVVNGRLYEVGGGDGRDLDTVEVFDPEANQWIIHSRMKERLVAFYDPMLVWAFFGRGSSSISSDWDTIKELSTLLLPFTPC